MGEAGKQWWKAERRIGKTCFCTYLWLESVKQGDTEFVLTLNHVITETSEDPVVRNVYTSTSKAYRLTSALNMFGLKAGQKPTKIKVIGQVNTSKNSLEGATEQVWEYTVK